MKLGTRPLITNTSNEFVTDSRAIATAFGKRHDNILQQIDRKLRIGDQFISTFYRSNFRTSAYCDVQGRRQRIYRITSAGAEVLTAGFTGNDALRMRLQNESSGDASGLITNRNRQQYLYVMASASGLCKVGIATNVESRRATLESSSGYQLITVKTFGPFHKAVRLERLIHARLGDHRQVGEWFACKAEFAVKEIEAICGLLGAPACRDSIGDGEQLHLFE